MIPFLLCLSNMASAAEGLQVVVVVGAAVLDGQFVVDLEAARGAALPASVLVPYQDAPPDYRPAA